MVPLFTEWIASIGPSVESLYVMLSSSERANTTVAEMPFFGASHSQVVDAWLELAFALLREARETYDASRWIAIREMIESVVSLGEGGGDRCFYEDALWNVSNIRNAEAKSVLAKWNPSGNSPLSAMRKAGLLAELDELDEARSLLNIALRSVRNALLRQGQNIELLSIEGWCTYLIFSIEPISSSDSRQEFLARWAELKAWDCDPWSVKEYFTEALSVQKPLSSHTGKITNIGFDPGVRTVSHQWNGDAVRHMLPAFAYIRLFEQVGIPLRLGRVNMGGNALQTACRWIDPSIGNWSPAILVRAGHAKELKEVDFLSRTGVASMPPENAARLHKWGAEALRREIASLKGRIDPGSSKEAMLEILPELISRLAFKVDSLGLEESFQLALQFHRAPGIRSHDTLHEACKPWFKRIFAAAVERQLLTWLPSLIRAPFFEDGTQSRVPDSSAWPDPMQHFPSGGGVFSAEIEADLLPNIESATDWLLKRAQSESGEARRRALARLTDIYHAKLMTDAQQALLGELLWENVSEDNVPDTRLALFSYLHLPSSPGVDVIARIRARILKLEPVKRVSIKPDGKIVVKQGDWQDRMISEVVMASRPLVQLADEARGLIDWDKEEAGSFWDKAFDWWENEKQFLLKSKTFGLLDGVEEDSILATLGCFDLLLARVVIPQMQADSGQEWERIFSFIADAKQHGVHLMVSLPYVLLKLPEKKAEVESDIASALESGIESAVEAGSVAVRHWTHLSNAGFLEAPSSNLIDQLVNRVAYRRPEGVRVCIRQVSLLLVQRPEVFTWQQIQTLISSLAPWHDALRLPIQDGDEISGFAKQERPDLRVSLGMMSSALVQWLGKEKPEMEEPASIDLWRRVCEADSLPEVKRSFGIWSNDDG